MVLITLGLIGVVAAMTIPTLVSKYEEKSRIVASKKNYTDLSSAYQLAVMEYGAPNTWDAKRKCD